MLERHGYERTTDYLLSFSCRRNIDVQNFLRDRAIPYEKNNKSRTYLVIDDQPSDEGRRLLLAFFTLAIHAIDINDVTSNSMRGRLHGLYLPSDGRIRPVPCYLIGQIGKDDRYSAEVTGDELILLAISIINSAHRNLGGRFIKIDCEDAPNLIALYNRNDFREVQKEDANRLVEMVRFF